MTVASASGYRVAAWRPGPAIGLSLALVVASVGTVQKYLGSGAAVLYALAVVALVPLALRVADPAWRLLDGRYAVVIAVIALVILAAIFFVVYPHANTHSGTVGSDRDDAADLGGHALLDGRYPYTERTYLAQPISQFPGGLLFAVPFVALGHSAYAALFWLPVFFLLLVLLCREPATPVLLLLLALVVSPALVREVVTGGDLVANSVAVLLAAYAVIACLERRPAASLAAAAGLGVALSWRLNYVFVLPPLLAVAARRRSPGFAVLAGGFAAAAFAAVTVPFWVGHGHAFTPFDTSDRLSGFDGRIPGGAHAVLAVGLALSLGLAFRAGELSSRRVFADTAFVQSFFVLAVVVLASSDAHALDLGPLVPGYGLPVLFFALAAGARPLPSWRPRPVRMQSP